MRGRGRNDPHRRTKRGEEGRSWPMLAIDYGYLRNVTSTRSGAATGSDDVSGSMETKKGGTCILFGTEAQSDLSMAMVVPGKGNAAGWISQRIAMWMDKLGSKRFTLKLDNEPAIKALAGEVAKKRRMAEAVTLIEHPEEMESQSNAHAEGGVGVM